MTSAFRHRFAPLLLPAQVPTHCRVSMFSMVPGGGGRGFCISPASCAPTRQPLFHSRAVRSRRITSLHTPSPCAQVAVVVGMVVCKGLLRWGRPWGADVELARPAHVLTLYASRLHPMAAPRRRNDGHC